MNFSPRMQSQINGFSVLGELAWRSWTGAVADVWNAGCESDAEGIYMSPDPRLFVVLDLEGEGGFQMDAGSNQGSAIHVRPGSLGFIPAGVAIRGRARSLTRIKHLDLHIHRPPLVERFGKALDENALDRIRLQFDDAEIAALAGLLARECESRTPLNDLYGDGIVSALLAKLFAVATSEPRRRAALSRQNLRLATEFIESNCFRPIRLGQLAAMCDLSETHFSHAFKASTGVPPHRWQMQARIDRAKRMLADRNVTLIDVATAMGFSDQAHFSRVFKSITGVTPSAWLRDARHGRL